MAEWCLPWWHNQLTAWAADTRAVTDCPAKNDRVPRNPQELLAEAAQTTRMLGIGPPTIQTYSIARNLASESDASSTAEELVVLGQAVTNESMRRKTSPAELLLTKGCYGKGPDRFSSTDKDPTAGHLVIATFVLSGHAGRFGRGACAYVRPRQVNDLAKTIAFLGQVFREEKWGWAGHYPNIDIRRLFVLVPLKENTADQIMANQQGLADLKDGKNPPPPQLTGPAPWDKQPINWKRVGKTAAIAALGSLTAVGTAYAVAETNTKRWTDWEPPADNQSANRPELPPVQAPEPDAGHSS